MYFAEIISLAKEVILHKLYLLMFFAPLFILIGLIIHLVNTKIHKGYTIPGTTFHIREYILEGLTGLVLIAPFFYYFVVWFFDIQGTWNHIFVFALGATIGFMSFMLDDLGRSIWEQKWKTLPLLLGLAWGATWISSAIFDEWKLLDGIVVEAASDTRADRYVWTYHQCEERDSTGRVIRTWDCPSFDYYTSYDKMIEGQEYPKMIKGIDYIQGTGYQGVPDKIEFRYYRFFAFRHNSGDIEWFTSFYSNLKLPKGRRRVALNFFNEIIDDKGGREHDVFNYDIALPNHLLPPGSMEAKAVSKFAQFFGLMFTDAAYSMLRWIFISLYLPLLLFYPFVNAEKQNAIAIFFFASTIIILIILLVVAARSGQRIGDFNFSFGGFGGGRTGGGGAGSKW